jgi:hypothetical protein
MFTAKLEEEEEDDDEVVVLSVKEDAWSESDLRGGWDCNGVVWLRERSMALDVIPSVGLLSDTLLTRFMLRLDVGIEDELGDVPFGSVLFSEGERGSE